MCPSGYMDGEILRPCGEMKTLNHQWMVGYVIIHAWYRGGNIPRRVRAEGPSMTGRNYEVAECPKCRLRVLVTVVGSAMLIDPISQCEPNLEWGAARIRNLSLPTPAPIGD